MPLYSYIVSYRSSTHAVQGRYSNFKGFAPQALAQIPDGALPGLTPVLRKDLARAWGEWEQMPELSRVWRTRFEVGDHEMVVYAVETRT
ncbi:hypothetical protein H8A95_21500 [Bradyrhizobium sp. Pear76]|uniref:hypothetical protein n=1 Tax=Bradyrhizobium oropedii TaxID=1571201 RepID=UPI001E527113|nr:hypothetical protein [Bradyrhizobium oropedii]MCC8964820.1 hypothetical protein [Bradyrhizobium oropedii]